MNITRLPAPDVTPHLTAPGGPASETHTCLEGPLCAAWWAALAAGPNLPDCTHDTCMTAMCERCQACFTDAMADQVCRDANLLDGLCPQDGTPLTVGAPYGAPGIGHSAQCALGHPYAYVGGLFHRPEDGAHIARPEDVI